MVHHPYWGKGIATEAHYLALKYGFEVLKLHRVAFSTNFDNVPMRTFFETFGIRLEAMIKENVRWDGVYKDSAQYAILEQEWPEVKRKFEAARVSK